MSNSSIWFEEVDTALVNLIQKVVKLKTPNGVVPCPVVIRKPEDDFKIEQYPCISIYLLNAQIDKERLDDVYLTVDKDIDNHVIISEKGAIPYNLFYQIDFYTQYQTDINNITSQWLAFARRDFNLELVDMEGTERNTFVLQTEDLFRSDLLNGNSRIFHAVVTYRIYAELKDNNKVIRPMVTDVVNKVNVSNWR